jgi:very-short-patch-repair endonuclease
VIIVSPSVASLSVTDRAALATGWWGVPPLLRVSHLVGVQGDLLALALDPLPPGAPAVVRFRPPPSGSLTERIELLLGELDRAAVALFPSWLPGAGSLDGPRPLGVAAVRILAAQAASGSSNFGPFLADLASRGLYGVGPARRVRSRFPAEVRAAGLGRILPDAYKRADLVVLIDVPDGLSAADEHVLAAAAEWLTHHARVSVWLAGPPLRHVDRIRSVSVTLPTYLATLAADAPTEPPADLPVLTYPPLSGCPRRDSLAEMALERGLAPHDWARGRHWNHTIEWHTLARVYRLDLYWPEDGLVVEVDGPEHRGPLVYADDRLRDRQLQLLGYDVLRFTNEQVLHDVQAAVVTIRDLLAKRRDEKRHHV